MTPTGESKRNLLGLSRAQLEAFFAELGEPAFRASQVLKWIHQFGVTDFQSMTNLGKALRAKLGEAAEVVAPEIEVEQKSADGTRKWLLRLADGNAIEAVFIPEAERGTLCVSSQVGCALDCTFCSTARQGFNRNLTAAEVIGQLWVARQKLQPEAGHSDVISNIVMMGMGEPLLNFRNVVPAMELMMDDFAYGLARRRVTLSTSGVVPAMDRLKDAIDVSLAVSLHAPDDELRNRLVPLNRKYPIRELMAACRRFAAGKHKFKVTFEYVMLRDVNDSVAQAHALVKVLKDIPCKVNLIPFNPFPKAGYERSAAHVVDKFRDVLMAAGIVTITRKTRGDDIDAACGQLTGNVRDRSRRELHFARLEQRVGA